MRSDRTFTGKKGFIEAILTLHQEEHISTLSIDLKNSQACERYHLTIDQECIQAQDLLFTSNIDSIVELYEHLTCEFDRITLTQDGAIIFEIEVMIKKKVERKAYSLQAEREKVSTIDRLIFQIEKMRNQININLQNKDRRIAELEQRQKQVEEKNRKQIDILRLEIKEQIKAEMLERINDTQIAQRQLFNLGQELKRTTSALESSNRRTRRLVRHYNIQSESWSQQLQENAQIQRDRLFRISRTVEEHQNKIKDTMKITDRIRDRIRKKQESEGKLELRSLKIYPRYSGRQRFIMNIQQCSIEVIKVFEDYQYMSYFGAERLEKQQVHFFQVQQTKTRNRQIMIGIGSKNAFEVKNAYNHKETITYYSYNGYIWSEGSTRRGGYAVEDGSVVSVSVDLIDFTVEWRIDGKSQAIETIHPQMRNSSLYLLVIMCYDQDRVNLLL